MRAHQAKMYKLLADSFPQSDADCDEVGHQQGHGPSLTANEREGV